MSHLLCFGYGFSAQTIARQLKERGWKISGTSRSQDGVDRMKAEGVEGFIFDPEEGCSALNDATTSPLNTATHVLISVPPGVKGDPVLYFHRQAIIQAPNLQWIGYLSTIGVYGNHDGDWVDEKTPTSATSPRALRRINAEKSWLVLDEEIDCHIKVFRLAGIYGPGRNALKQLRAGRARRIIKEGQVFNRIHVEDIAQVVTRTIDGVGHAAIYNLADNEPAPPQDVISFAAQLLEMEPPPEIAFEEAEMSDMARSFYADLKRVRNDRIKTDLDLELIYPTYREGLRGILKAEMCEKT